MKYIGFIIGFGLLSLSGCKETLEDYYGKPDDSGVSDIGILEQLEKDTVYTEFLALLKETGFDQEFAKDILYTVWAPADATMPDTIKWMSLENKKIVVANHLSYMMLYRRNLEKLSRVKMLSGKYLKLTGKANEFLLDGAGLENTDQVCCNGVIHGIREWLLPRKNIYEWLEILPDEYSMFRDTLLARNARVFDKSQSVPVSVNEMGQTVYDTVWKMDNPILAKGDIRREDEVFTFFIPDNVAVRQMYEETTAWLRDVKCACTAADSAKWMTWLLQAAICKDIITVKPGMTFKSVHGKELRSDVQQAGEFSDLSNGRAYRMTYCHIPRNMYFKTLEFNPYYNRYYAPGEYDQYTLTNSIDLDGTNKVVKVQFEPSHEPYTFTFLACNFTEKELFYPVQVMPGLYKVTGQFNNRENNKTDSIRIWVNDRMIATISGVTEKGGKKYQNKQGVIVEEVQIGDTLGPVTVKLQPAVPPEITPSGAYTYIGPGRFVLTPADNY